MTGMTPATAPLSALSVNPSINARGPDPGDCSDLVAIFRARGDVAPIVVRPAGNGFEVIDGTRRKRAAELLWETGEWPAGRELKIIVHPCDDAEARELSLALNHIRADLSPIREAEAFQRLVESGLTAADIAVHFARTPRFVAQRLALGTLPAEIREAAQSGALGLDAAQAFTLAKDAKQASKLFKELGPRPHAYQVRNALSDKAIHATSREAKFVGEEAYVKAGGAIRRDLFGDDCFFDHPKLLAKLLEKKLKAEEERLRADGWGFVAIERQPSKDKTRTWPMVAPKGKLAQEAADAIAALDLEIEPRRKRLYEMEELDRAQMSVAEEVEWDRLEAENYPLEKQRDALDDRPFTVAQKAAAGAVIRFDYNDIEIVLGLSKPGVRRQVSGVKDEEADDSSSPTVSFSSPRGSGERPGEGQPEEPDFTGSILTDLSHIMGGSLQMALAEKPGQALRLLLAVLLDSCGNRPFNLHATRYAAPESAAGHTEFVVLLKEARAPFTAGEDREKSVAEILDLLDAMAPEEHHRLLALLLADALNWHMHADRGLIRRLEPDIPRFWRADETFFTRLNRKQLSEALSEAQVNHKPGAKKPDLVAIATRELPGKGWLPAPLRTESYAGPGSNAWIEAKTTPSSSPLPQAAE